MAGQNLKSSSLCQESRPPDVGANRGGKSASPRPGARKVAAYRARQRLGLAVLRVPVLQHDLAEALIEAGRLSPGQTLERAAVEHEVAELVHEWARRWLEKV